MKIGTHTKQWEYTLGNLSIARIYHIIDYGISYNPLKQEKDVLFTLMHSGGMGIPCKSLADAVNKLKVLCGHKGYAALKKTERVTNSIETITVLV